jgi:hypothetical protein
MFVVVVEVNLLLSGELIYEPFIKVGCYGGESTVVW